MSIHNHCPGWFQVVEQTINLKAGLFHNNCALGVLLQSLYMAQDLANHLIKGITSWLDSSATVTSHRAAMLCVNVYDKLVKAVTAKWCLSCHTLPNSRGGYLRGRYDTSELMPSGHTRTILLMSKGANKPFRCQRLRTIQF